MKQGLWQPADGPFDQPLLGRIQRLVQGNAGIVINDANKAPLQLGLSMFSGERGTEWGALMAASTISVLASLVIVALMQKQLSRGINMGGFGGR